MIILSEKLNYKIIGSGSSGNSVLIGNVLMDCGLPFQRIKPYLKHVDYLIITHIHTDHLKLSTYNRIRKLYPRIITIGNWQVSQEVPIDIVANATVPIETEDYTFLPIEVPHDVLTYGYFWTSDDGNVLYCTDTYDTTSLADGIGKHKIDYLFLESNHDEKKIEPIRNNSRQRYGYDAYSGAKRHLSTQQAKLFYYLHRRSKDSVWVELHKSSRFY